MGIIFQFLIINAFFHIMLFLKEGIDSVFQSCFFFFFNVASIRKLLDVLQIKIQVEEGKKTLANNKETDS